YRHNQPESPAGARERSRQSGPARRQVAHRRVQLGRRGLRRMAHGRHAQGSSVPARQRERGRAFAFLRFNLDARGHPAIYQRFPRPRFLRLESRRENVRQFQVEQVSVQRGLFQHAGERHQNDQPSVKQDQNLLPSRLGSPIPHRVQAGYFGINGDGHFGRLNVTNSFYQVIGRDTHNGLADGYQRINAQMGAAEFSVDFYFF